MYTFLQSLLPWQRAGNCLEFILKKERLCGRSFWVRHRYALSVLLMLYIICTIYTLHYMPFRYTQTYVTDTTHIYMHVIHTLQYICTYIQYFTIHTVHYLRTIIQNIHYIHALHALHNTVHAYLHYIHILHTLYYIHLHYNTLHALFYIYCKHCITYIRT